MSTLGLHEDIHADMQATEDEVSSQGRKIDGGLLLGLLGVLLGTAAIFKARARTV